MKSKTKLAIAAAVAASIGLAACENMNTVFRKHSLDRSDSFVTDAKQRVIVNTRGYVANGRNNPDRIICAEPSPDVAQAISTSLSAAIEADAQRADQSASGSGAIAASVSEGIAQLGERLATIQLLRDGFYRACEAYANGAISDTMYSLIVGNIDDVMVTLLTTEMAAGAFGRQLAGISGTASAAAGEAEAAKQDVETIQTQLTDARNNRTAHQAKIAELLAKPAPLSEADAELLQQNRDGLAEVNNTIQDLEQVLRAAQKAFAKAHAASLVQVGGGINSGPTPAGVQAIAEIYKGFTQRDSMGSLISACVAALDRSPNNNGRHPENQKGGDTTLLHKAEASIKPLANSAHYGTELTHVCKHLFHSGHHGKSVLLEMFKRKLAHTEKMAMISEFGLKKDVNELYGKVCKGKSDNTDMCDKLRSLIIS